MPQHAFVRGGRLRSVVSGRGRRPHGGLTAGVLCCDPDPDCSCRGYVSNKRRGFEAVYVNNPAVDAVEFGVGVPWYVLFFPPTLA